MTKFQMPKLRPIPIKTKGLPWWLALWVWMSTTRQWELLDAWRYRLEDGTRVEIPAGFVFDGASIPKIFRGLVSPVGVMLIQGLLHDCAYRYNCLFGRNSEGQLVPVVIGSSRAAWDELFRFEGCRVNGLAWLNRLAWFALVVGGWAAWSKHRKAWTAGAYRAQLRSWGVSCSEMDKKNLKIAFLT